MTATYLPGEEQDVQSVEGDVEGTSGIVALLHGGHQRRGEGPQHGDGRAGIQVGTGEQLAGAQEGVQAARDGDQHAEAQEQGAPVVVLLVQALADELLALLWGGGGDGF